MMMIAYIIKLEKNVKSSVVFFWKQHTRILEIFEIQRPHEGIFENLTSSSSPNDYYDPAQKSSGGLKEEEEEEENAPKRIVGAVKIENLDEWREEKNVVVSFLNETFVDGIF